MMVPVTDVDVGCALWRVGRCLCLPCLMEENQSLVGRLAGASAGESRAGNEAQPVCSHRGPPRGPQHRAGPASWLWKGQLEREGPVWGEQRGSKRESVANERVDF